MQKVTTAPSSTMSSSDHKEWDAYFAALASFSKRTKAGDIVPPPLPPYTPKRSATTRNPIVIPLVLPKRTRNTHARSMSDNTGGRVAVATQTAQTVSPASSTSPIVSVPTLPVFKYRCPPFPAMKPLQIASDIPSDKNAKNGQAVSSPPLSPTSSTFSDASVPGLSTSSASSTSNLSLRTVIDDPNATTPEPEPKSEAIVTSAPKPTSEPDTKSKVVAPKPAPEPEPEPLLIITHEPTTERGRSLQRAVSNSGIKVATSPVGAKNVAPRTPEEFQSFVEMAQSVIRESRKNFRPLPSDMTCIRPRKDQCKRRGDEDAAQGDGNNIAKPGDTKSDVPVDALETIRPAKRCRGLSVSELEEEARLAKATAGDEVSSSPVVPSTTATSSESKPEVQTTESGPAGNNSSALNDDKQTAIPVVAPVPAGPPSEPRPAKKRDNVDKTTSAGGLRKVAKSRISKVLKSLASLFKRRDSAKKDQRNSRRH